jgi:uncharacterized protein (DUF2252 family)
VSDATGVVLAAVTAYADRLRAAIESGRHADFEVSDRKPCGCAPVDDCVSGGANQSRSDFISERTEKNGTGRHFLQTDEFYLLSDEDRQRAGRLLADYQKRITRQPPNADYYRVEDVCGRISGIGSMGRYRYAVLLRGKAGGDARNVILEFKEARPSGYDIARGKDGGDAALPARATAVIAMQQRSQAGSNGHLGYAVDGGLSFQVRELGPADGRVRKKTIKSPTDLQCVAKVQGEILARIHTRAIRAAVGPTNPLPGLADPDRFSQHVLTFALRYADLTRQDFDRFTGARAELEKVAGWV